MSNGSYKQGMAPRISPHTPLSEAQLELVAERFRALAVPSRLRVLNALMGGALGMSELAEATGLQQSNLSRQVTELERAGCVARVRDGREVTVQIADPTLAKLCELVCGALQRQANEERARLYGR
jgi:ArsR family transcriptional regulator